MTAGAALTAVGDGEADGRGLPDTFALVLLPGSVAQPAAAKIDRAIIRLSIVFLTILILDLPRSLILALAHLSGIEPVLDFPQFGFLTTGDGEATGEAVGLGLVAGVVTVLLGEAVGEGDDVTVSEFELFAGSQAAANSVNKITGTSRARLMGFELLVRELVIRVYLVRTILKSGRMLLERGYTSNGCSHRSFTGIAPSAGLKPSFAKECLHDLRTGDLS